MTTFKNAGRKMILHSKWSLFKVTFVIFRGYILKTNNLTPCQIGLFCTPPKKEAERSRVFFGRSQRTSRNLHGRPGDPIHLRLRGPKRCVEQQQGGIPWVFLGAFFFWFAVEPTRLSSCCPSVAVTYLENRRIYVKQSCIGAPLPNLFQENPIVSSFEGLQKDEHFSRLALGKAFKQQLSLCLF